MQRAALGLRPSANISDGQHLTTVINTHRGPGLKVSPLISETVESVVYQLSSHMFEIKLMKTTSMLPLRAIKVGLQRTTFYNVDYSLTIIV